MSAEALRKAVIEEIEKLNVTAMNNAIGVRPTLHNTADGIALMVVDNLAMARAYAHCAAVVEIEFRKLTSPPEAPADSKRKVREVY